MAKEHKGRDNLVSMDMRSKEEAREMGRAGGKASVIARREKKRLRMLLRLAAEEVETNEDTGEKKSRDEWAMVRLASKAANGELKAIELMAKILGELTEKHELTGADGQPIQLTAEPPRPLSAKETKKAIKQIARDI